MRCDRGRVLLKCHGTKQSRNLLALVNSSLRKLPLNCMKRLQNGSWSGKFCLYREPYGKCGQCNTTKYLIRRGIEVSTIAFDATNLNATKTRQRVQDLVQLLSMLNNCNVHGIKEFIIKSPYYLEHNYVRSELYYFS